MRSVKATVAVMAAAVMFSSLASPAAAFTDRLDDLVSHFIDCKLLLLTDLEAHVRECGGGKKLSPSLYSLSEQAPGGAAPPVVTEPPKQDEEPCEGFWCHCNQEYSFKYGRD